MKEVILVFLLIASLLAFAGCSSRNQLYDDAAPQEFGFLIAEDYTLSGKCNGITPYGAAVLDNSVLICDMGDNCLKELDFQGNEIRCVGQLGNGSGEFICPSGLAYRNERFYVVDSGNSRIQVLDKNLEYQSEYALDKLSESASYMYYTDIAVCENGVVTVLTNSVLKENARVYLSDSNGSVKKTPFVLNGYTYCEKDMVYCTNTFELFENDSSYDAIIQESFLYELVNGDLRDIFKFPYKYGPTDFIVDGDDVYVLSCVWSQLDHFKTDGSYLETIWRFDSLSPESFLERTPQEGFVVTDGLNNVAYFLSRKSN
ncbi:MAG: hypothetical protein IKM84_07335 [Oscillospiraceae bacterium]|nr:hypothetical protein [Oscillospiraceae bacterium]